MRRLLLLAVLALPAAAAQAQIISVYGTFSAGQFSNVPTSSPQESTAGSYQTTNFWADGVGGGVTLGILPVGPIHIGLDFRGSTKSGTSGADTAFGGLRIGVKLPLIRIKPYLQASGGYIATRTPTVAFTTTASTSATPTGATTTNQYAGYEIIGGVDYRLLRILDFRVIEVGGGKGYDISGASASSTSLPSISILTVNTGFVLHF